LIIRALRISERERCSIGFFVGRAQGKRFDKIGSSFNADGALVEEVPPLTSPALEPELRYRLA
jgi:hypothetical protein